MLFDLYLKTYETIYPIRIGNNTYKLFLRKKPVGVYECVLKDENEQDVPCRTDRPAYFGKPRKQWNKVMPYVGGLLICGWILLLLILSLFN